MGLMRLIGGSCAAVGGLLLLAGVLVRIALVVNPAGGGLPVERTMDIVLCAVGIMLLVPGIVVLRMANAAACNEPLPAPNGKE
jgi:hypothetical protein